MRLRAVKRGLRRVLPEPAKAVLRRTMFRDLTVAQGWDRWARLYGGRAGEHLGDEWTDPSKIGIDVPAERVLSYLDEEVFAPFLGTCEVMLEIGPGGGRFTQLLVTKCERLIAVDTSTAMLKLLRDRFGEGKVEYLLGDGLGLTGVADASVDRAFSYGVFVHLPHWDIYNYLRELRRVLKAGGRAIVQHANTFSELGWKKFLADLGQSVGRQRPYTAFSVMTPELMRELVERAGLRVAAQRTDVARRDCITLIEAP